MAAVTPKLNSFDEHESAIVRPPRPQRAYDLIIAIPFFILLLPLLGLIAVWIMLDSPGPVFFLQERVGLHGRIFRIFKFRTMVRDAESHGHQITIGRDPRITAAGRLLRKFKLDELPQLLNIIRGEMSLVGPRPEVPRYVALYNEQERQILRLRPGITSPASIAFNDENHLLSLHPGYTDPECFYRSELIPAKIRIDLEYARRATILSDSKIIMKTILRLIH